MWRWADVREDVREIWEKMWRWADVKMRRCERRCEDEKMWEKVWRWADVKMSRCEDEQMWEKMWRWADVKMSRCERRCEDEQMWRWEDVIQMWRCEDEKIRYRPPLLEEPCAQTLSGKKKLFTQWSFYTYLASTGLLNETVQTPKSQLVGWDTHPQAYGSHATSLGLSWGHHHYHLLIFKTLYHQLGHQQHFFENNNITPPAPSIIIRSISSQPGLSRTSVGNSASRRLLARKPSSGIIFLSSPTRPSVMTCAQPCSVAATSSNNGDLAR